MSQGNSSPAFLSPEEAKGFSPGLVFKERRRNFIDLSHVDESERDFVEWSIFSDWAERRGVRYDSSVVEFFPGTGGHEHTVLFGEEFIYKRTAWDSAGLIYDPDLDRLHLQDSLFLSDTEVLGILCNGRSRAIFKRQIFFVRETLVEEELHLALSELGFNRIRKEKLSGYKDVVYQMGNIYLSDVRADNCCFIEKKEGIRCLAAFDFMLSKV